MYEYEAELWEIINGNCVELVVHLGFGLKTRQKFTINMPVRRSDKDMENDEARFNHIDEFFVESEEVKIVSERVLGRNVAQIFGRNFYGDWERLNDTVKDVKDDSVTSIDELRHDRIERMADLRHIAGREF